MSQLARENIHVAAERAVLAAVHLRDARAEDSENPFEELRALAETAGARVVGEIIQRRQKPSGATYLGKGKVEELAALVQLTSATLVLFDNDLSPSQISNIERATSCKVIDRSELILDIFANRATTHAAKLQVEIAQLEYTYPRLRAMWDHLGQVVGGAPVGIGTRGPGEQQLEIDRRIVQRRKKQLRRELEEIEQRKQREVEARNISHFTAGLVGYTNAGKSTLFNRLTHGGAYADDRLFSTLSTRVERWSLGGGNACMLSDTVGFIRDLPHHLVASFRSTLEETHLAALLLIVVDATDRNARSHLEVVRSTLNEIGATSQPRILLLNKVDAIPDEEVRRNLEELQGAEPTALAISARTGGGIDALTEAVLEHVLGGLRELTIRLPLSEAKSIDFIEKRTKVIDRDYADDDVILTTRIGRRQIDQLLAGGTRARINGEEPLKAVARAWSGTHVQSS